MEKRNSRFADLDFLASGEFLEKNQTFFKELENDPRVIYFFEESDRGTNFDLLEVNVENAIPVPVLFEILGMEWDEEIALDEVVASIEERGIRIVAILDREVWDDEQRRRREEEEAKKWAKIDCRKECRAVDRFYNDTFSHWCSLRWLITIVAQEAHFGVFPKRWRKPLLLKEWEFPIRFLIPRVTEISGTVRFRKKPGKTQELWRSSLATTGFALTEKNGTQKIACQALSSLFREGMPKFMTIMGWQKR